MHIHTLCIHHARTTRTQCACRSHTTPTPCTYRAHAGVRDDRYGLHASDGGPAWSHTSSPQRQSLATCGPRQPGALLLTHGSPLGPEPRRPSAPPSPPAVAAPSPPSPPPLLPPPRLRRCIQVALAGLMMRSLQMATRLRHAFDPSAGYAAGATLVQHGHTVAHARSMVTRRCIHAAR